MRDRLRVWAPRLALAVGAVLACQALRVSWNDVHTYGGVDLRDKVVFARLLWAGQDPYFVDMRPDWPETLIDPNYYVGAVRISITPPAILLYLPLSGLPYQTQRVAWYFLEWAALLGACALLAHALRPHRGRTLFLALALIFFAGGYFWRLHVERGQYYSCLLFLLALATWISVRKRHALGGVPLGLAMAIRPTLLVVPLFLWLTGQRKLALTAIASCVLCMVAALPITGVESWKNYVTAMRLWEIEATNPDALPARTTHQLPTTIEGVDCFQMLPARTSNTSALEVLGKFQEFAPNWHYRPWLGVFCKAVGGLLAAFVAWRIVRMPHSTNTQRHALAVGIMVAYNLDYLLAPARQGYVDVILLLPLALLMPLLFRKSTHRVFLALVLAGLILGMALNDDLGTYYRSYLTMLGFNALVLVFLLRCRVTRTA